MRPYRRAALDAVRGQFLLNSGRHLHCHRWWPAGLAAPQDARDWPAGALPRRPRRHHQAPVAPPPGLFFPHVDYDPPPLQHHPDDPQPDPVDAQVALPDQPEQVAQVALQQPPGLEGLLATKQSLGFVDLALPAGEHSRWPGEPRGKPEVRARAADCSVVAAGPLAAELCAEVPDLCADRRHPGGCEEEIDFREELDDLVKTLREGNGFICAAKFRHTMLNHGATDEEIDEMLREVDVDDDGQIKQKDFEEFVKTMLAE